MTRHARTSLLALLIVGALATVACGGGNDSPEPLRTGSIGICFEAPEGASESPEGDLEETLDGEVVYDKAAAEADVELSCNPSRVLQIDVDGELWSIGYRANDADGEDITPDVGLEVDQAVQVDLVRQMIWGTYEAFAVTTKEGHVLAMNDGYGVELPDGAVAGLEVTQGAEYGAESPDSCGTMVGHTLVFSAETSIELESATRGTVELASGPVDVMNVASWSFGEDLRCTDIWGPDAWMAFRTPTR